MPRPLLLLSSRHYNAHCFATSTVRHVVDILRKRLPRCELPPPEEARCGSVWHMMRRGSTAHDVEHARHAPSPFIAVIMPMIFSATCGAQRGARYGERRAVAREPVYAGGATLSRQAALTYVSECSCLCAALIAPRKHAPPRAAAATCPFQRARQMPRRRLRSARQRCRVTPAKMLRERSAGDITRVFMPTL